MVSHLKDLPYLHSKTEKVVRYPIDMFEWNPQEQVLSSTTAILVFYSGRQLSGRWCNEAVHTYITPIRMVC